MSNFRYKNVIIFVHKLRNSYLIIKKMRKTLFPLVLVAISAIFMSYKIYQNPNAPHIKFETESYNYGVVVQGANGDYSFRFTNTGKEPLIITEVKSTCGCTIPKKPEEPILPGKSDVIKVHYDTQRIGSFTKYITVNSNADNSSVTLTISGEIKEKPKEEVPMRPNPGLSPIAR